MPPTIRSSALSVNGANGLNADQLQVDMMGQIYEYDANSNPLLVIVQKKGQVKKAKATTVKHLEDEPIPEWDAINFASGYNASATAMVVDNAVYYRLGSLVRVMRTGEVIRVTNRDTSSNTIFVTRAWGGTAASIVDNDVLLIMPPAEMEGDLSPEPQATVTVTKSNFVQIFKDSVKVTKTEDNHDVYGGNERIRQRRKAAERHARMQEQALIWGRKKEDTSSFSAPVRSTGGLDEHIQTNVLALGGLPLTENTLEDFIGDSMRFSVTPGRKRKLLIASREVLSCIGGFARGRLQTNSGAKQAYGIDVNTYIGTHGTLDLMGHPLLENGAAGVAFLIDTDGIVRRPYRDTVLETNIQAPGEDAFKDQYLTEQGYSFALEKCFGKITGCVFA